MNCSSNLTRAGQPFAVPGFAARPPEAFPVVDRAERAKLTSTNSGSRILVPVRTFVVGRMMLAMFSASVMITTGSTIKMPPIVGVPVFFCCDSTSSTRICLPAFKRPQNFDQRTAPDHAQNERNCADGQR